VNRHDDDTSDAMERALRPSGDAAWVLDTEGYDGLRETSIESRFAISNGFLGVRGARAITRGTSGADGARTYVAGLFDTPAPGTVPPALVLAADWLQVRLSLPEGVLIRHPGQVTSHVRKLDLKRGALLSGAWLEPIDPRAAALGVQARTLRLVSLHDRALGLQLIQLEIEAGDAEITLEASFAGLDVDLVVERIDEQTGVWRTRDGRRRLAMATASALHIDGRKVPPTSVGKLGASWTWRCRPGQTVCFDRLVAAARADTTEEDPETRASGQLAGAARLGWRGVLSRHESAWAERWRLSDVEVEGDPAAQEALRFALYHLNSAANPADERVSIAARALTGPDYGGHVFWDTEIYLLPFYTLTWPQAARSLLMYRFHTLDGARAKAASMGWRGALYAWESADTGEEATPKEVIGPDRQVIPILSGRQEQHISADVAYAVWQYWRATGDEDFLKEAGAEILLETARFWASRARLEAEGRRHIRGVIGPDEYHEDIDDNAFTNVMARWNIRRGLEVATLLRRRWPERWTTLAAGLRLDDAELAGWAEAAEAIGTGLDPKTGLFEQFAGFNGLEQIDLGQYEGRSVPMDVVLGRERTQKTQVVKQADVVALLGLLPEEFPDDTGLKNFRWYAARCSHGSSLSRAMHGLVAARLGLSDAALGFFRDTAAIDLGDTHVAIDGGIHIAALGGLWSLAVQGFAGLALTDTGVALDPKLPEAWRSLSFSVQWRGRCLRLAVGPPDRGVEATLTGGEAMTLTLGGKTYALAAGKTVRVGEAVAVDPAAGRLLADSLLS
jgi:trehalose/maltose hydrolase-like predicted phosphorylase